MKDLPWLFPPLLFHLKMAAALFMFENWGAWFNICPSEFHSKHVLNVYAVSVGSDYHVYST